MPPKLVEQLADVGGWLQKEKEHGLVRQARDDGETALMLQYRRLESTARRSAAELIRTLNDGRNMSRDALGIEMWIGQALYDEPVSSEHDSGLNAFAAAKRSYQVANSWQSPSANG